jgi:hypothetical protein
MALKFPRGKDNNKLKLLEKKTGKRVYSFSLLSGHTCPFAKDCKSMAIQLPNGKRKIQDGPDCEFRCFSASQEAFYTGTYNARKHNTDIIQNYIGDAAGELALYIQSQLPEYEDVIYRLHVAGDFFHLRYFKAWLLVARMNPSCVFYTYTKAIPFWIKHIRAIPDNFILTASYGGTHDHLIDKHGLRYARVVPTVEEANRLGLEIDHDDSHAYDPSTRDKSFALLIHGLQPPGSMWGKAVKALKGVGSYGK